MELQWPLIIFTSLLAWSAGLFATQAVYALRGEAAKSQMAALITSAALMVVGGVAVFLHLQHWERIFNGFGHLTSGITQELIAVVAMAAVMVVYFAFLRRRGQEGGVPKWLAILAIACAVILCAVMAHSYMMASRPAWNSVLQILSIIGAACAFGPATMAFIDSRANAEGTALDGILNLGGTAINAVTTVAYLAAMSFTGSAVSKVDFYFDPVGPTRGLSDATSLTPFGGDALVFTLLAILCAVAAVVCAFMGKKQGNWKIWGIAIMILTLVAAVCLRVVFYQMGVSVYPYADM